MRDAESIEAQLSENATNGVLTSDNHASIESQGTRIAPWRWKPGQSGNPNGRPRHDFASFIAQKAFENNPELIYKGLVQALGRGSGFVFQVASDRAYGKLKERLEITGTIELGARLEKARKRKAEKLRALKQAEGSVK